MIKGVDHAYLGPIWYHSEPSDLPYSPNQFLALDFFAASYSKIALTQNMTTDCLLDYEFTTKLLWVSKQKQFDVHNMYWTFSFLVLNS